MLNKGFIIVIALMLSACAQTTSRTSYPGQVYQQQAPLQLPAYPLTRKADIRLLQQRLKNQNYDPGLIDGILGVNTHSAIRQFQRTKGYPVDGRATTRVLQQLDPYYVPPPSSASLQRTYDSSTGGAQTAQSALGGAAGGECLVRAREPFLPVDLPTGPLAGVRHRPCLQKERVGRDLVVRVRPLVDLNQVVVGGEVEHRARRHGRVQRDHQPADAFDDDDIARVVDPVERMGERRPVGRLAQLLGGDGRRKRCAVPQRVDDIQRQPAIGKMRERLGVVRDKPAALFTAARSEGFAHPDRGARPLATQRPRNAARDHGLADVGIRAGDEQAGLGELERIGEHAGMIGGTGEMTNAQA